MWTMCGSPYNFTWSLTVSRPFIVTSLQGFRLRPEAGGRTLRPVVFHSMPGTLISIFEGFFYYFIIIICFYLSISWIYWLEDNRILQLNYSKLPHYFFRYLPPPSPTTCPFSLNILLFKENLSELWPLLGNWYLVSSNAGNNVSECSLLKISWGSIPPDPPR